MKTFSPLYINNSIDKILTEILIFQGLRSGFPGLGNGPPPPGLNFGPWKSCWGQDVRARLESILRERNPPLGPGGPGAGANKDAVTFHAYQEMAGESNFKLYTIYHD